MPGDRHIASAIGTVRAEAITPADGNPAWVQGMPEASLRHAFIMVFPGKRQDVRSFCIWYQSMNRWVRSSTENPRFSTRLSATISITCVSSEYWPGSRCAIGCDGIALTYSVTR
ncbi:MAG: hypothetical protein BWY66_00804 [bacterium ADurb.Bin374]|nr:MAG: hypothetical protein BWY66_00804 [bacterium ADurb.Bin374]